jgi:hypothetical protein
MRYYLLVWLLLGISMLSGQTAVSRVINVVAYGADPTGVVDSTTPFLNAYTATPTGGTLYVPPGTYKWTGPLSLNKSINLVMSAATINSAAGELVINASNVTIDGQGTSTFNFAGGDPAASLDRAIRVLGGLSAEHNITGSTITVGATSFVASSGTDAATLSPGDWIIIVDEDPTNWQMVEWKQVASVVSTTINVTTPFALPFGTYTVKWMKVTALPSNVVITRLAIKTTDPVNYDVGIDAEVVRDITITKNTFNSTQGLAFSVFLSVGLNVADNVITSQTRRSNVSSTMGGYVGRNTFYNSLVPVNGCMTIETGISFVTVDSNTCIGGTGGSGMIYANQVTHSVFSRNTIIADGSTIGIYSAGSSNNQYTDNVFVNVLEGIRLGTDTQPTPNNFSHDNLIIGNVVRTASIGVNISSGNNKNNIFRLDYDASVTTPIQDNGTNTIRDFLPASIMLDFSGSTVTDGSCSPFVTGSMVGVSSGTALTISPATPGNWLQGYQFFAVGTGVGTFKAMWCNFSGAAVVLANQAFSIR